jgi:preprotein translocase subunit SecB
MNNPSLSVAAQYVRYSLFETEIRPYELKSEVRTDLAVGLSVSPLPDDGHYRVELSVVLRADTASQGPAYVSKIGVEAIAVLSGIPDEEVTPLLKTTLGPNLLGAVRVILTSISASTGYGPIVLPPFSAEGFLKLPESSSVET